LGFGDCGLRPIPNPQSPIPNPQSPMEKLIKYLKLNLNKILIYFKIKYIF